MDDAAPVRITFERGSAAAVNRRFIGGFFAFAILFAWAAFYRPAIQAFAVGFPIYLVLWKVRLRSATRPGWALVVSREELRVEGDKGIRDIVRTEVTRVEIVSARSQARLLALNAEGKTILRLPIAEESRRPIEDALRTLGWPLGGQRPGSGHGSPTPCPLHSPTHPEIHQRSRTDDTSVECAGDRQHSDIGGDNPGRLPAGEADGN